MQDQLESGMPKTTWEAPPADFFDPVIEAYKRDVDRTLLRENLRLSVSQRFEQFDSFAEFASEIYAAGKRSRAAQRNPASK